MGFIVKKDLTDEQKEKIEARKKPSAEDVQKAVDDLFLNLLLRVAELEEKNSANVLSVKKTKSK